MERDISLFETLQLGRGGSKVGSWLRSRFTHQPQWQAFVDGQTYYQAFLQDRPGRALISHSGPLVGDELQQVEIIDAISTGRRLFVVSGSPGSGKSRFALELARRIGRDLRGWEVLFVRNDERAVRAEIQALSRLSRLVLIVDDAHDCPQLVQLLAGVCAAADPKTPVHLVCLTRPAGRAAVTASLATHFPVGAQMEVDLKRPSGNLVRELIDKLLPEVSPHHRDMIRRLVGDSFFAAVLLCTGVSQQKKLPQTLSPKHLRDYVLHQPIARAVQGLCTPEKALRALAVYAACSPARPEDIAIRESAAKLSGLSLSDVEILEQRMVLAGLFRKDELGLLRPVPDLSGDLILEETCLDEQGRPSAFGQAVTRQLFEHDPDAVIRNCVASNRLFSTSTEVDLVGPVVLQQAAMARPESPSATLGLLKSSRSLAQGRPGVIVSLFQLLEERGAVRRDPPAHELGHIDNIEVQARDLLLQASTSHIGGVRLAMEYSRDLFMAARSDPHTCAAMRDSLAHYCRFSIGVPVRQVEAVLEVLHDWAVDQKGEYAELAASLLKGYLQLDIHGFRWEDGTLLPQAASFALTDDIARVRDRALAILVQCAEREQPGIQYEAAQALQAWLQGYGKLDTGLLERWVPQLERESRVLTESFSKLGAKTPHLPVRAAVERQGWRLWISEEDGFAQVMGRQLLQSLPAGNSYSLWKALHDDTVPVMTVAPGEQIAGKDRGDYFLALTNPGAEHVTQRAKALFDELKPLHAGSEAWLDLYASVLGSLPKHSLQHQVHLYLAEFVVRHPDEAWSLVTETLAEGPMRKILPNLLAELRRYDNTRWQAMVQQAHPETHLFDAILRALWVSSDLSPAERAMVVKGLDLEDSTAVHRSAQALLDVPADVIAPSLRAVLSVLRTLPSDERLWELAIDGFARWGKPIMSAPPDEEPSAELRAIAGELLVLLRTAGRAVNWSRGPHTRVLAAALAVIAVAVPHTLKAWIREVWYQPNSASRDDSPLSMSWLSEVARLIAESPAEPYWQKQFLEWMRDATDLSIVGARGLAQLCGLTDPCVAPLVERVVQNPTTASLTSLAEFVRCHGRSAHFADDALALLLPLTASPEVYGSLEEAVVEAMVHGRSGPGRAQATQGHESSVDTLDRWSRRTDLPPRVRETLARAKHDIHSGRG